MTNRDFVKRLRNLYHFVWRRDIPSPTVPEYVEHHRDIQEILNEILRISLEIESEDEEE